MVTILTTADDSVRSLAERVNKDFEKIKLPNKLKGSILVTSHIDGKIAKGKLDHFQNFDMTLKITVYAYSDNTQTYHVDIYVEITDCRAGQMISDKCSSIRKYGNGYIIDCAEITVTTIRNAEPESSNLNLEENAKQQIWKHENKDDGKDLNDKRFVAPGKKLFKLTKLRGTDGFKIIFLQKLGCKATNSINPLKSQSKLDKKFPKILHKIEIKFENIENINKNFINLRKFSENYSGSIDYYFGEYSEKHQKMYTDNEKIHIKQSLIPIPLKK